MVGDTAITFSTSATTYYTTNTSNTTACTAPIIWANSGNVTVPMGTGTGWPCDSAARIIELIPDKLPAGQRTLELPDGAKLVVDDAGNYRIEDKDAKVTYQANRNRDFSPHLNASDMLAQFVRYAGSLGVRQTEVLNLPIELFVNWLIVEAAERDHDPVPADVVPVADHAAIRLACRPRCLGCGRFVPRLHAKRRFMFCGPAHAANYLQALPALKA